MLKIYEVHGKRDVRTRRWTRKILILFAYAISIEKPEVDSRA